MTMSMDMPMTTSSRSTIHSSTTGKSSLTSSAPKPSDTMMSMAGMNGTVSSSGVMETSNGCRIKVRRHVTHLSTCPT